MSREQARIPHYDRTLNAYPHGAVNWEFSYGIYDLLVDPRPPGPFDLDVGGDDDLQVLGMHPRTVNERGGTYRWTTARSIVWVAGTLPDASEVTLRMSKGGRPEAGGVAEVRISLNDQPLGSITVPDDGFRGTPSPSRRNSRSPSPRAKRPPNCGSRPSPGFRCTCSASRTSASWA